MAASHQISADITPSLASIRSSINKIKSAMSKVTIPINLSVTKKSVTAAHKQIQSYFSTQTVQINIAVSRSSLASARKQLQASLSAVSIPQISLKAGVSRQIGALVNSLTRLQTAGPTRATGGGGSGGGGGRGGRNGGSYGRNSSGGLNLPLGHLSGEASEFSKSMDAATARVFAFGATAVVLNSVAQSFSALVTSTIEVEKKLTEIKAIFNESDESFARFRDTIFDVAANTGQTFETVAGGAAELARQGLSAAETTERLNAALVLTRTAGIDAETSVSALTAVINGFSSAGLNANQIVNKVVAVDTAFAVSAKDLTDGFARAGSTAEDAGVSFDQLLGLITALQQKTARGGAVIGNGLKTIFTRISRGGVIEDLKALGVQISESQNGIEKLQAIGEAFESASSDPVKQSKIKELAAGGFQINLISAALKDLNAQQSIFTSATKTSQNASTEAFDRNREQNETIAAQINGLVASLTNLSEKIGQVSFAPLLKGFVESTKGISDSLSNALNPEAGATLAKSFFDGFGSFVKGPLALIVGAGILQLFRTVAGFAKQGLQDVLKLNSGNKEALAIQKSITGVLEQNARLQGLIANQNYTIRERSRVISAEVNKIVNAERVRLETLQRITSELQKQGGFLRKDGSIGFDKSRGDRFKRRAGEIAQNPATAIVASIGVGAAVGSLKNADSNQVKAESLGRQIDLLKTRISELNPELDALKIENLNARLEKLTISLTEASASSDDYKTSVDRVGTAAASTIGLWSITGNNLIGLGGAAATAALALREFLLLPKFESLNNEQEAKRAKILGDGISVTSEEDRVKRFLAAQERLSRGFDLLNESILKSAQSFNSELKERTKAQSLVADFKTDDFDFLKSLNDLRPDSESKRTAKRDIERRGALIDTTKALEKLSQSGNAELNRRASEAGFSDVSKIPSGDLRSLLSPLIDKVSQSSVFDSKTSGLVTGKLSPDARKAFLRPESATNEELKKLGEELSGLKNVPDAIGAVARDLGKTIKGTATGQDILQTQSDLTKLFSNLKNVDPTNETAVGEIIKQFDRFLAEGIGDENSAEEILGAINKERSVDRNFQLEDLQARINLMKEGEKSSLDALNKSKTDRLNAITKEKEAYLDKIEKEKELNDSFLDDLRKIYGQDIDRVRNLREGSLSKGLTSSDLNDFASKSVEDILNSLGIEGSEQKGITGQVSPEVRAGNLIREVTKDFSPVLDKLTQAGQKIVLSETDRKVLFENQSKLNPSSQILSAAGPAYVNGSLQSDAYEKGLLQPFVDASNLLKNARTSEDFTNAKSLYEKGQSNLGLLSLNKDEEAALTKGLFDLAQQFVLFESIFRSQGIRAEGAVKTGGTYDPTTNAFTEAQRINGGNLAADAQIFGEDAYAKMEQEVENAFSGAIDAAVAATIRGIEAATQSAAGPTDINRQAGFGASNAASQKATTGTIDVTSVQESMTTIGQIIPALAVSLTSLKTKLDEVQKQPLIGGVSDTTGSELEKQGLRDTFEGLREFATNFSPVLKFLSNFESFETLRVTQEEKQVGYLSEMITVLKKIELKNFSSGTIGNAN